MSANLHAIRGMHDILPTESPRWRYVEKIVSDVLSAYGYTEMRMPIVEKTELFLRSIGEVTDIVEKEMYTFSDRNGESLTLRPEGTAGCVRACIEHAFIYNTQTRLWYHGPMFRHERPQKGRYRQFYQIGVEAFGIAEPDLDAELILISHRIWQRLGIRQHVKLEINSLGTIESRRVFRDRLVEYLNQHADSLDEDSKRRLQSNPLRILDSKNPDVRAIIANAPKLADFIDAESAAHFSRVKQLLDQVGIEYVENPYLVRGLDYYSRTVFEWTTELLGAQSTICAGGRYDGLVEMLGGKSTPACGLAMGMERVIALADETGARFPEDRPDAYVVSVGDNAQLVGLKLVESLRDAVPSIRIVNNCGGGSFKAQMKRADRSGARWALLLGDDEVAKNTITVKPLRDQHEQLVLDQEKVAEFLLGKLNIN